RISISCSRRCSGASAWRLIAIRRFRDSLRRLPTISATSRCLLIACSSTTRKATVGPCAHPCGHVACTYETRASSDDRHPSHDLQPVDRRVCREQHAVGGLELLGS